MINSIRSWLLLLSTTNDERVKKKQEKKKEREKKEEGPSENFCKGSMDLGARATRTGDERE